MKHQEEYYDIPSSQRTPIQTREKLAELAAPIIGSDKLEAFKDLLKHKTSLNGGTDVTDELKYTSSSSPLSDNENIS